MSEEKPKLTNAQEVFISEYLQCFNGTEAYSRAYPKAKRNSARTSAAELLANPNISEVIQARLAEVHMSADEALKLTADIARGDVGEFINDFGGVTMDEVRKAGKTRLIKKWKTKTVTINGKSEDKEVHTEEIELYDAQAALRDILKVHGRFIERQDITSNGEAITHNDDSERFDRAITSLANALRETVPNTGNRKEGTMDATK